MNNPQSKAASWPTNDLGRGASSHWLLPQRCVQAPSATAGTLTRLGEAEEPAQRSARGALLQANETPPMTLGNRREQVVHQPIAYCHNDACRHQALIDACPPKATTWKLV